MFLVLTCKYCILCSFESLINPEKLEAHEQMSSSVLISCMKQCMY